MTQKLNPGVVAFWFNDNGNLVVKHESMKWQNHYNKNNVKNYGHEVVAQWTDPEDNLPVVEYKLNV